MKSTTLVTGDFLSEFTNILNMVGIRLVSATTVSVMPLVLSVEIEGECIPDALQVRGSISRSHEGSTSTLKIEWIPVASDSDDQGEEE